MEKNKVMPRPDLECKYYDIGKCTLTPFYADQETSND